MYKKYGTLNSYITILLHVSNFKEFLIVIGTEDND